MMGLHVALVVVAQDDDSEEADAASQIPAEFQGGVDTIEICGQLLQHFFSKNSMYIRRVELTCVVLKTTRVIVERCQFLV